MTKKVKKLFIIGILSAIVMAVMPIQKASATGANVYSVTYNLTGAQVSPQDGEIIEGSGLDVVFTADDGYELPNEISVQIAGEDISNYIYENGNLIINEVNGDVVITLNAVPTSDEEESGESDTYSISYDLYEVTASKQDGNVRAGTRYSVKLKASSGFRLDPLNVAVRVNGDYVTSGYSFNEGLLEIDAVNGDVVIEAIAVQRTSSNNNNSKKNNNNKNNDSSNNNNNNATTNNSSDNNTKSSSSSNSSKSSQALSNSGKSAQNYSTGSYRAPKTGDDSIDIRYYGALALIFIGAGFVVLGKKSKKY